MSIETIHRTGPAHSRLLLIISLVAGSLLVAGCSSTPTRVDSGAIGVRTFSFVSNPDPVPAYAEGGEQIHTMIQNAITRNLASKGVSGLPTGGDAIVAYLVIVGNNATTTAINTYFGYGRDYAALTDKAHEAYTSNKNPNYFEAGTLLVDIIDARTNKLLKRSYVVRPILRNLTPEVRAGRIQEAVDAALKDLRIAP